MGLRGLLDFKVRSCPLSSRKRTFALQKQMSAMGQKRTCAVQNRMSALPPIADIARAVPPDFAVAIFAAGGGSHDLLAAAISSAASRSISAQRSRSAVVALLKRSAMSPVTWWMPWCQLFRLMVTVHAVALIISLRATTAAAAPGAP